jgi:hypothetical protein
VICFGVVVAFFFYMWGLSWLLYTNEALRQDAESLRQQLKRLDEER